MIRHLLELLSRDVVLRRRLPVRFGGAAVFVSPGASLRYWLSGVERASPELFRWAGALVEPGDTVWDIGANLGLFSMASAFRAGQSGYVVAVEPDPWLGAIIRRSVAGLPGKFAPVEIVHAAVAEREGEMELIVGSRGRASNHLAAVSGSTQSGAERMRLRVLASSLDLLMVEKPCPALIKIDVEGAELLALRGAAQLLSTVRPVLLIEVGSPNAKSVAELLRAAEYRMYDAERCELDGPGVESPTWNTLAIPSEHARIAR